MRLIDAEALKKTFTNLECETNDMKQKSDVESVLHGIAPEVIDDEPTINAVPIKDIYDLRKTLSELSDSKYRAFQRTGCDNEYLQGKAHAYSIVVDMIDDIIKESDSHA